jgi:RNA recognition motif-containing protein
VIVCWIVDLMVLRQLVLTPTLFFLKVNLPRGYGYIEYKKKADAEKALLYMNGVCILP